MGRLKLEKKRASNTLHHQNDDTYLRVHTMLEQVKKLRGILQDVKENLSLNDAYELTSDKYHEIKFRVIALLDLFADIPEPIERKRKRPRGRQPHGKIWHKDFGWIGQDA